MVASHRSLALLAFAALGCGPTLELAPVVGSAAPLGAAPLTLARVDDARTDPTIGRGRHHWLRVEYEVDTDADVAAWLGSYLRASFAAHAHDAAPAPGEVDVTIHRFAIAEATWARGTADLEVRVRWRDGGVSSRRMTVVTTELMTDDDAGAWSVAAGHSRSPILCPYAFAAARTFRTFRCGP